MFVEVRLQKSWSETYYELFALCLLALMSSRYARSQASREAAFSKAGVGETNQQCRFSLGYWQRSAFVCYYPCCGGTLSWQRLLVLRLWSLACSHWFGWGRCLGVMKNTDQEADCDLWIMLISHFVLKYRFIMSLKWLLKEQMVMVAGGSGLGVCAVAPSKYSITLRWGHSDSCRRYLDIYWKFRRFSSVRALLSV